MAGALKVLGQANPAATTDTNLYTVPAATTTVVSNITVTRLTSSAGSFRIRIGVAGAAAANKQYLAFGVPLLANDVVEFTLGVTLATTDIINVYASDTNITFQAFGQEIT